MDMNKIRELTDVNDHGSAYFLAAQMLGSNHLMGVFSKINEQHRRLGYLPPNLCDDRYAAYQELMSLAKRRMSAVEYSAFYKCF